MTLRVPKYRLHKGSGQAVVGINHERIYLGVHGTAESKEKYSRIVAEWLESRNTPAAPSGNGRHNDSHIAVGVRYEHTRALMLRLLDRHEQTGRPFAELLDDVAVFQVAPSQAAAIGGNGDRDYAGAQHPQADARTLPNPGHPTVAMPVTREPAIITPPVASGECQLLWDKWGHSC